MKACDWPIVKMPILSYKFFGYTLEPPEESGKHEAIWCGWRTKNKLCFTFTFAVIQDIMESLRWLMRWDCRWGSGWLVNRKGGGQVDGRSTPSTSSISSSPPSLFISCNVKKSLTLISMVSIPWQRIQLLYSRCMGRSAPRGLHRATNSKKM